LRAETRRLPTTCMPWFHLVVGRTWLKHLQPWCSVCDPAKYFSHLSFVIYFLATPPARPPMKMKLGQQIGGELLTANRLDESLWWANQKHW
jgi:hypothetical protein